MRFTGLVGALLVLTACASGGPPRSPLPPLIGVAKGMPPLTLDEANRTWAGARCELLLPIGLGRGPDDEGFYWNGRGGVLLTGESGPAYRLYAKVTGRDRLGTLMRDNSLQPGVRLISEGWDVFDRSEGKGPHLNFRLEGTEERVRLEFAGGRSTNTRGLDVDNLRALESWARLQMFRVEPANEQLAPPPPPVAAAPAPEVATGLRMVAVSARPARISAGRTVDLIAHYEVTGGTGEILERRSLELGGRQIWTSEDRFTRAPGSHSSAKPLNVPADAAAGVYTISVEISSPTGTPASGTALFEVIR